MALTTSLRVLSTKSTPLATIAVAAREMERQIEGDKGHEAFADDAKLIRQETARCHAVLERLSVAAGVRIPMNSTPSTC